MKFERSSEWKKTYPGASVGVLILQGVENPKGHHELDRMKGDLEERLRSRYASEDRRNLREIPTLAAYHSYYQKFGKTYHVQHQLESVVFKGKGIPSVAGLVEAMFMAELSNLLLTAGHDLKVVEPPLRIDVAMGNETYLRLNGVEQRLKTGDMMISDQVSILSCILYGPDQRTRIRSDTRQAVFTVYAPPGIPPRDVHHHLEDIRDNVKVIAPGAKVDVLQVISNE